MNIIKDPKNNVVQLHAWRNFGPAHKPDDKSFSERLARIRDTLDHISALMATLKEEAKANEPS